MPGKDKSLKPNRLSFLRFIYLFIVLIQALERLNTAHPHQEGISATLNQLIHLETPQKDDPHEHSKSPVVTYSIQARGHKT